MNRVLDLQLSDLRKTTLNTDHLPPFLAQPCETASKIAEADWVAAGFRPQAEWPRRQKAYWA